jgi:predicted nucleotidyltransferase
MVNLFDAEHQVFLDILNKHNVEYLLIGGMAVNIHGYSRGTGDLDIWISSSQENKEKMIKAISDFGYDTTEYEKMKPDEITMFSLGSRKIPGYIEITNRIAGIQFDDSYKRVQKLVVEGISVSYIHFDDLIRNKLASARPRDLDDVENLKRIKRSQEKEKE